MSTTLNERKVNGLNTLDLSNVKIVAQLDTSKIENADIVSIIQAIEVRQQVISQNNDPVVHRKLQDKLNKGGIYGSHIIGVNTVEALKLLVTKCTVINFKEQMLDAAGKPTSQWLYELQLPEGVKAVTVYEEEHTLNKKGLGHYMFHDGQREGKGSLIFCSSSPVLTNKVSFIVDDNEGLKIWYAGPNVLAEHYRPSCLETTWVRLGVTHPLSKEIDSLKFDLAKAKEENAELHNLVALSGYDAEVPHPTNE